MKCWKKGLPLVINNRAMLLAEDAWDTHALERPIINALLSQFSEIGEGVMWVSDLDLTSKKLPEMSI